MSLKTESESNLNDQLPIIGFFLVDGFSPDSLMIVLHALKIANQVSVNPLYETRLFSANGGLIRSNPGLAVETFKPDITESLECLIMADLPSSNFPEDNQSIEFLNGLISEGAQIGCIGSAAFLLANAGLVNGHTLVVNTGDLVKFQTKYPGLSYSSKMVHFDGLVMSCAGGVSALDMILGWLTKQHNPALAMTVSEQLNHIPINNAQPQFDYHRLSDGLAVPRLSKALELMHENIESPLSLSEIARQSHMSLRQMQRLFQNHLKTTPGKYYQQFRLKFARQLLLSSNRKIIDICLSTGFESQSHFTSRFKELFGHSPGLQRKTTNSVPEFIVQEINQVRF